MAGKEAEVPLAMQHGTRISPTLGASWKVKGTWIILEAPFIQLLGYNFSTLQFCHLYFIYLKICGFSLRPLIAQCSVQASLCPSEVCCSLKYAEAQSLEQHLFLGHWAGLMARRAAGFKGPSASPQRVRPWKGL